MGGYGPRRRLSIDQFGSKVMLAVQESMRLPEHEPLMVPKELENHWRRHSVAGDVLGVANKSLQNLREQYS